MASLFHVLIVSGFDIVRICPEPVEEIPWPGFVISYEGSIRSHGEHHFFPAQGFLAPQSLQESSLQTDSTNT
jgi:hypothetical protein